MLVLVLVLVLVSVMPLPNKRCRVLQHAENLPPYY
jgi:hypothetical protein